MGWLSGSGEDKKKDASERAAQSPEFTKAYEDVKNLQKLPDTSEQKMLYSLAKVGKDEVEFNPEVKVSAVNWTEGEKRAAWKSRLDEGLTPADAQTKYVEFVEQLKTKYGTK